MIADTQTITLRKVGQEQPVQVVGRMTPAGNVSFEYAGIRHILKPDGSVLQMVRYAYTGPSWQRSPVLSVNQ